MAGRNTFKHGPHLSATGEWVGEPRPLSAETREMLEDALGRPLTNEECQWISTTLAAYAELRQYEVLDRASRADVKRTLWQLASTGPEETIRGLEDCDEETRCLVLRMLGRRQIQRDGQLCLDPVMINYAAVRALKWLNETPAKSGRIRKLYHREITRFAVASWSRLEQTDWRVWFSLRDLVAHRSRLHRWATAMFRHIDGTSADAHIQALLKQALSEKPEEVGF